MYIYTNFLCSSAPFTLRMNKQSFSDVFIISAFIFIRMIIILAFKNLIYILKIIFQEIHRYLDTIKLCGVYIHNNPCKRY